MNNANEITLNEFKEILEYMITQNSKLQQQGKSPIAVGIEGPAGVGKTSIIEQIANEHSMTMCKLNLSQLEEVGDLTGFPIKEYYVTWTKKDGNKGYKWIPETLLSRVPSGVTVTDKIRMGYAPPSWLPSEENPNGTILLLDDYTRASNLFMQATMELINEGRYVSWSLPKNTSIILTSNPDNGEFSVSSLDTAQKTRFINFTVKLNIENWASWAENAQIDGKCINFCLLYGEEIFKKHNGIQTINPRSYTTFCKAISGIDNWNSDKGLSLILTISKGCFMLDTDNTVGNLFTTFIANKLDKLVQPKDMLMQNWDAVEPRIYNCVYDSSPGSDPIFKPEIASILAIRLLNHILYYFSQKGVKENVVEDRLLDFINNKRKLFSDDLLFHIIKTVINKYPGRTTKLLMNSAIRNKITM
jgi:hypothetical protein